MASIPKASVEHYKAVLGLQAEAVALAQESWSRVSSDAISETLSAEIPVLSARLRAVRWDAAYEGSAYSAMTLAEQGAYKFPTAWVDPTAFVEFTPTGGEVADALYTPAIRAKKAVARSGVAQGMKVGQQVLYAIVASMVADTARQAAGVDIAARKVGYVRMLNPPSCMRCTILAGRFYRWNTGFLRHPRCDCVHVPTGVKSTQGARDEGLIDDPYEYFRSLSEVEQDKIFGQYDAQAVRDGADIFQVVNSRRGRSKNGLFTTEGTTKRGYWRQQRGSRYPRRGTPEWIYRTAKEQGFDHEQTLRMLEVGGYILPGGQNPTGAIRGQAEGFGALGGGGRRRRASDAVIQARMSGRRDPNNPYTMTAAERRVWDAQQAWKDAQNGYNPFTEAALERRWSLPRTSGPDKPVTQVQLAQAEESYRYWLLRNGNIYTE